MQTEVFEILLFFLQLREMLFICHHHIMLTTIIYHDCDGEAQRRWKLLLLEMSVHLIRLPPCEGFQTSLTGRRPWGRPRIRLRDYTSHVVCEGLRIPNEVLEVVASKKKHCCLNPDLNKWQKMDEWEFGMWKNSETSGRVRRAKDWLKLVMSGKHISI